MEELDRYEKQPVFSELDFGISRSDVESALKRLNKKAAPGVDKISAKLLFAGKTHLMPLFVLTFNKVFTYASYPLLCLWTQNFLKPIHKKVIYGMLIIIGVLLLALLLENYSV